MSDEKDKDFDQSENMPDGFQPEEKEPSGDEFVNASNGSSQSPEGNDGADASESQHHSQDDGSDGHHHGEKQPNDHDKKKKKRLPVWLTVLIIVVAVLVLSAASAYIAIHIKLNKINRPGDVITVPPESEDFETDADTGLDTIDPDSIDWPADVDLSIADHLTNILLIGQDTRNEYETGRSDSMIILTINRQAKTISLTSLMRDMYVQIPGYSDNRINAAYRFGGYDLLEATIEKNFGIKTDAFVKWTLKPSSKSWILWAVWTSS